MSTVDLGLPGLPGGLKGVPAATEPQTRKDFTSDQEVRWCPGCGDYAILATMQRTLPTVGADPAKTVFLSGIGCSSRFPYYMNTYGFHSIHGRAPAFATGLKLTNPELDVWVVTGDGDGLSIGGNHLMHLLRRNVDLQLLLFNNRIYGLTKGQYSPTSEPGKVTKSTPMGSVDNPFNPVSLALGAEATFVARTVDSDRKHLTSVLRAAAEHRGTSFVEIYQNCPIFNDNAFEAFKDPETRDDAIIPLVHGEPIRFGKDGRLGVVRDGFASLAVREVADLPGGEADLVIHDAHTEDPAYAFALSRLTDAGVLHRAPIGVFRSVERPAYDDMVRQQITTAQEAQGTGDLQALVTGADTWTVN